MRQIIQKRRIYLSISAILVLFSVIFIALWGVKGGIDFTGGSLLQIRFKENPPSSIDISDKLAELNLDGGVIVQSTDNNSFILRFKSIEEKVHQDIITKLQIAYGQDKFIEDRYESIGPAFGREIRTKAFYSIILVLICIILYIAYSFRKVSWPVKSWKYGVVSIVALCHDIIITIGVFAFLGKFFGVEVGLPFIAALLTILGYSINDTIVVFDRIRENLSRLGKMDFEELVNRSVNETIMRSLNTALTTIFVLLTIFFFGGESIRYFAFALIIGVGFGTYSSIFIASPLLVVWHKLGQKK